MLSLASSLKDSITLCDINSEAVIHQAIALIGIVMQEGKGDPLLLLTHYYMVAHSTLGPLIHYVKPNVQHLNAHFSHLLLLSHSCPQPTAP